ncbi:helix-turn-helix transcriptional regulator [Fibrella aquatilis]|uniref:HTH luxR-type domain-containing protein n=1 Tax=Fibrella aquatilis TaxID=2817059 RepID=A0A939K1Z8_9BACT|nr:hypothetical protein [Fibrella aquatilis]MBO0934043.1 hypothetical protein [Fibrella aquatilis]
MQLCSNQYSYPWLKAGRAIGLLVGGLCLALRLHAQPFLQQLEWASPAERVRMTLFYFDTCRAVVQSQPAAFRVLDKLDKLGLQQRDTQLRRYVRLLRDSYAKNTPNRSPGQNAQLFLTIARKAEADSDEQIAGVAEHFAGQYYYLGQDYGKAFQYLLSANGRFRQIGYANVPEIHRYLYELAFNYYHFYEDTKVIALLTEAANYPPFNPNLHIQTFNTLAMAYTRQRQDSVVANRLAEQFYQKAYQLAVAYRDSVWMGITTGNLGSLYAKQGRWQAALNALRLDYRLEMPTASQLGYPMSTAIDMANAFYELGQLDSCRVYLGEAGRFAQFNTGFDYSQSIQRELFWQQYYKVARKYHQHMGNLPELARCTDSLLVYEARVGKRHQSKAAALAEQRLLVQQYEAEVASLERRSLTQWLLLGAGVGLAMLLGWLYRSSLRRRQQEARANAEREQRLEREKQHVSDELDRAVQELNQFLEQLQQDELNNQLSTTSLLTNEHWTGFRQRFERVHPAFFKQLRVQFADLTPAEERLLALSKLHIDTLRMSHMLGISQESIRKAKYRLRKKLGVEGASSLSDLLE